MPDSRQRETARDRRVAAWDVIKSVAPPVGFDPAIIWPDGPDSADCGILRFDAHRVLARPAGTAVTAGSA